MANQKYDLSAFDKGVKEYTLDNVDLSAFDKGAGVPTVPANTDPSMLESALRGAADYTTFGFADEGTAALEHLLTGKPYEQARDESRAAYEAAAAANPVTYHGSGLLAGLALPLGAVGGMATKGLTTGAKLLRTAQVGAGMGALAGAGSSTEDTAKGVLGDVATGAVTGAIAGPVLETVGSVMGRGLKGTYENIIPVRDAVESFKYGTRGVRVSGEKAAEENSALLKGATEALAEKLHSSTLAKNAAYTAAEDASTVTVNHQQIQDLIDTAEKSGVKSSDIKTLQDKLNKLIGKTEEIIVDPVKYNEKVKEELAGIADKLKEDTIKIVDKEQTTAQTKAADKEYKEAFKSTKVNNKEILDKAVAELKLNEDLAGKKKAELTTMALKDLKDRGLYINPEEAATAAHAATMSKAAESYKGPAVKTSDVTKTKYVESAIAPDVATRTKIPVPNDFVAPQEALAGAVANNAQTAGINIQKLADTNRAQAAAIAEMQNKKALDKLVKHYDTEKLAKSRADIQEELKSSGQWVDPMQAATDAHTATMSGELTRPAIDILTNLDQNVMSSKVGEREVLKKIIPSFEFKETVIKKPEMTPGMLNELKQTASKIDPKIFGSSGDATKDLTGAINNLYRSSINTSEPDRVTKLLGEALKDLKLEGKFSTPNVKDVDVRGIGEKIRSGALDAAESKSTTSNLSHELAFDKLMQLFPEGSVEHADMRDKIAAVKEAAKRLNISEHTIGHNTFATSPTNMEWTLSSAGKIGFITEGVGLGYRAILESPPAKLLQIATDFASKGLDKYATTLQKIAGTQDPYKRRALTFTLLQSPEFRKAIGPDFKDK